MYSFEIMFLSQRYSTIHRHIESMTSLHVLQDGLSPKPYLASHSPNKGCSLTDQSKRRSIPVHPLDRMRPFTHDVAKSSYEVLSGSFVFHHSIASYRLRW